MSARSPVSRPLEGWIDRSERVLLERITKEYVGGDVLDVGVGGGRTVPLLSRSRCELRRYRLRSRARHGRQQTLP